MLLESKIKQAVLLSAIDISLKRMKKSPERCARNLMELGANTYPNRLEKNEYNDCLQKLLIICKNNDIQGARELFIEIFFQK